MSKPLTPVEMVLPEYLRGLNYPEEPAILELARRHIKVAPHQWEMRDGVPQRRVMRSLTWKPWEGIFQYLACVEYSRYVLHAIPRSRGKEIEARYYSTGLIFFAQATLDLIAVWLKQQLELSASGAECAFHKGKFIDQLKRRAEVFRDLVDSRRDFFGELNQYRVNWIHRLSGGTILNARGPANSSERFVDFVVPMDPETDFFVAESEFLRRIEPDSPRGERPLYALADFADRFGGGASEFTLEALGSALRCPDISEAAHE